MTRDAAASPERMLHWYVSSPPVGSPSSNTAVATARDIPGMARAFRMAIEAGRLAYLSGPGRVLEGRAEASSPLTGFLRE